MKLFDKYVMIKSIGKGNFGEVFKTQATDSPQLYATKIMARTLIEQPQCWKRFANEVNIIMRVKHPNIVRFVDLKKSINNWYLVTEYVNGGSLASNLKKYMSMYQRPFPEHIAQHLMKQIVDAINYLHFNKIIHRDLKLDNILVNFPSIEDLKTINLQNCQVKIIDFGFATVLNSELTFTALGTPDNMDPKILAQFNTGIPNTGYNEKVDIWSLGTLCYEMVVGRCPFIGTSMDDLYQKVQEGTYSLPATLSDELVNFINDMLQQDEEKRANAKQLMNHPFLVNPVNTFHPIDVKKIQANYISGGIINMNSKQKDLNNNNNNSNQYNIWTIFNQPEIYKTYSTKTVPVYNQPQVNPQYQINQVGVQSQYPPSRPQQNYYYMPQGNY